MSSPVDQIKAKLDIVSVVGSYVKLEKAGASFKAKCPFHHEKTASFFVSPDRGNYYCFGCGAKGDIFTFVQELDGLDFSAALKLLASRAGVDLTQFSGTSVRADKAENDILLSLLEQAAFYFEKNFSENDTAREYLHRRGLHDDTIKNFRIGLSLPEWRGLHDFLLAKDAKPEDMLKAGLVKQSDSSHSFGTGPSPALGTGTTRYYDTFRSRIMFPITDVSGRVVAFSGRIFPDPSTALRTGDPPPKYLNSPETPVFKKSETLFGLDKAKSEIRRLDYSILVEGQMDLVMMHQAGFINTVASSGTALTVEHLKRLSRLSNRIIFAFDGDAAGLKAVMRAAEIALDLGMEVKVAEMPDGADPADLAQKDKEALLLAFKKAVHIIQFVLERSITQAHDERTRARNIALSVLPYVARLSVASERAHFIRHISLFAGIPESALWEDVRKVPKTKEGIVERESSPFSHEEAVKVSGDGPPENRERSAGIARTLIGILWWQKGKKLPDVDIGHLEKRLMEEIDDFEAVELVHRNHHEALVFEIEAYYNGRDKLSADIDELFDSLRAETLKQKFSLTMRSLQQAEARGDTALAKDLLEECQKLSIELNKKVRSG